MFISYILHYYISDQFTTEYWGETEAKYRSEVVILYPELASPQLLSYWRDSMPMMTLAFQCSWKLRHVFGPSLHAILSTSFLDDKQICETVDLCYEL